MNWLAPIDPIIALLMFAGVVLLAVAVGLVRIRMRGSTEGGRNVPPLVYPVRRRDDEADDGPAAAPRQPSGDQVTYSSASPPAVRPAPVTPSAVAGPMLTPPAITHSRPTTPPPPVGTANGGGDASSDATLQLLPGRLEPVGSGNDQEIRFVRSPGGTRFTLGRSAGPAHTHVQLRSKTASRMHAFMQFEDGRWQIGNISQTNRVVVNGSPLADGTSRGLKDGDRVEFGELTFVFRER